MGARAANAVLGVWLFFSAFLWPHGRPQFVNAVTVGILAVTFALFGLSGRPWPRYLNITLGVWLMLSDLFLSRATGATFWNHLFVGLGLVLFGLAPATWQRRPRSTAA
jgi:hypothetical protein